MDLLINPESFGVCTLVVGCGTFCHFWAPWSSCMCSDSLFTYEYGRHRLLVAFLAPPMRAW